MTPRQPSAMVMAVAKALWPEEYPDGPTTIEQACQAAIAAVLDHLPRAVFAAGMDPDYADDENVLAHIEAGISAVKESIR